MSAEQWQLSLSQLYGTADALEAGFRDVAPSAVAPLAGAQPQREPALSPAEHRSLARVMAWTVAHTTVTVSLLIGASLLVDPLLPQGERPHLSAATEAPAETVAIPPYGKNRP